jgi:hypothetical protein
MNITTRVLAITGCFTTLLGATVMADSNRRVRLVDAPRITDASQKQQQSARIAGVEFPVSLELLALGGGLGIGALKKSRGQFR